MPHHDAFGLSVADLDIAIVENSRAMQTTLRSMLSTFGVRRIRAYDTASEALTSMLVDPPSVVITAWNITPMNGEKLIRTMRDPEFPSLCHVPVIVATAHATLSVIDTAFSVGCNALLAKPLSPQVLQKRLEWLVRDASELVSKDGRVVVSGMAEVLDTRVRNSPLANSIMRANALEAAMKATESAAKDAVEKTKEQESAAASSVPAPDAAKEAASRKPSSGDSREDRRAAVAKKRARRWHGWKIDGGKGSTAA